MKYQGSILTFTHHRNRNIIKVYRSIIARSPHIADISEIFARVASSPADRFWVSEERAAIVIAAMAAGKPLPVMSPNKQKMFREIFRRFQIRRQAQPDRYLSYIVAEIVNEPAPEFYLTPRTIGEIIYRMKKGWYDRNKRKH